MERSPWQMTRLTKILSCRRGASSCFYPAALPLSRQTLTYTAGVDPPPPGPDRLVLAQVHLWPAGAAGAGLLRKGETFAELAAGFGIGTTTAWRYVTETVGLLAARSPKLRTALRDAKRAGHAYVMIDGTLIPIDRVAADWPFYSGKHHRHGMNLHVISAPGGEIVWVSRAAARRRAQPERHPDLGHPAGTGHVRAGRAGGQGLPRRR